MIKADLSDDPKSGTRLNPYHTEEVIFYLVRSNSNEKLWGRNWQDSQELFQCHLSGTLAFLVDYQSNLNTMTDRLKRRQRDCEEEEFGWGCSVPT